LDQRLTAGAVRPIIRNSSMTAVTGSQYLRVLLGGVREVSWPLVSAIFKLDSLDLLLVWLVSRF
jgi:hypothetical protein